MQNNSKLSKTIDEHECHFGNDAVTIKIKSKLKMIFDQCRCACRLCVEYTEMLSYRFINQIISNRIHIYSELLLTGFPLLFSHEYVNMKIWFLCLYCILISWQSF